MYAIVETGGKQYQVEEGRYVDVELLEAVKSRSALRYRRICRRNRSGS